jgi:type IV pilus assembly protein PilB
MPENWRFNDEWILKALAAHPGADPGFIDSKRADKAPSIAEALADSGRVPPEQLGKLVEQTFRIKYTPLTVESVDKFALNLLQEKNCRKYGVVPVGINEIRLAMANPLNLDAQGDVEALTGRRVIPLYAMQRSVDSCMELIFSADKVIYDILNKVEAPDDIMVLGGEQDQAEAGAVTSPVIMLVNSIISQAYRKRSSDIHIEHEERGSHVRIRVDGVLRNIMTLPRHIASGPLVSRIKIMADLDVSNHLRPQDGRTKIRIAGAEVGLRVSTLPTSYGEKVVMRILDQRAAEVPFEKLGFAPEVAAVIEQCLEASQGIILVTGPTGSGKTTTLYSVLNKTRSEGTNIVTVEDPIEYKLAGINQVQVNEKQGLTFSAVLRSVLRQDPDIIMVGEIRDRETADIAFQAAMTGHMVFSTLHTNDAISTISRLMDMGVDRFKVSPGLLAITAQRLVRRLCPSCVERVPDGQIEKDLLAAMRGYGFEPALYRGGGCKACEGSGYAGRTSIVEILHVVPRIKDMINSGSGAAEITKAALELRALRTMTHDALWHLSKGHTDIAEVAPYISLEKKTAAMPQAPAPAAVQAHAPAAAAQPAPKTPAPAGQPVSRIRVLIAEDDPVMRLLLKRFVEGEGMEFVEAPDGEAALAAIAERAPDLLLTDIHMPKLDGFGLVKGVREALGLTDLPVVVLTTETSDKSQELAFQLGADDYVIKPFRGNIVMARIKAALRRSGKLK